MKKFIAFLMVCGFALAFVSCGGNKKAEEEAAKVKADSIAYADSTAMVKAEAEAAMAAAAEAAAKAKADSVAQAEAAAKAKAPKKK